MTFLKFERNLKVTSGNSVKISNLIMSITIATDVDFKCDMKCLMTIATVVYFKFFNKNLLDFLPSTR